MNHQQTRRLKRQVMNLIDDILDGSLSETASSANYRQSATSHTRSRFSAALSYIHTYNLNSWTPSRSLSTIPSPAPAYVHGENEWSKKNTTSTSFPSSINSDVGNRWVYHTITTQ